MASKKNNRVYQEIVLRPAASESGKGCRFQKVAALLAARDTGIVSGLLWLRHGKLLVIAGESGAGAGDVYPAFSQKSCRPIIRFAGVLKEQFATEVPKQGVHRIIIFQNAAKAFEVLREIDRASAGGAGDGLIFTVKLGDKILSLVSPQEHGTQKALPVGGLHPSENRDLKAVFPNEVGNAARKPELLNWQIY